MNHDHFNDFRQMGTSASPRPLSEILQEIVNHVTEIVRAEIRLARVEIQQDFTQFRNAILLLGLGVVFALYAFGFVLLGLVYALGTALMPWLAAIMVGGAVGLVAAIFLLLGRTKIKRTDLKPVNTIRSVQENVTWMKKQVR